MSDRDQLPLGLVRGMSSEAYHAIAEAIGSSGLRKLARTPLHFFGATLDPQRPPGKTSDAKSAGTLAHCALLEPDQLLERYAVKPAGLDGRTREGKAWIAEMAGRQPVTAEQLETAQRQAQAIRALPEIGPLLARGAAEVSAFWIDEATGVHCKCRPDWVHPVDDNSVVILDLKTTQDASESGFARTIWNYRYDLQAAWYSDGFEQASGLMVMGFVLVCTEAEWPHAAAAYMLEDHAMDHARAQIRELLDLYAQCKREDTWPGYVSSIQPISLPSWAR
jgi:PDDEXK-like domain of unknown function (DUF3799)